MGISCPSRLNHLWIGVSSSFLHMGEGALALRWSLRSPGNPQGLSGGTSMSSCHHHSGEEKEKKKTSRGANKPRKLLPTEHLGALNGPKGDPRRALACSSITYCKQAPHLRQGNSQ